jgi:hypothetical protein
MSHVGFCRRIGAAMLRKLQAPSENDGRRVGNGEGRRCPPYDFALISLAVENVDARHKAGHDEGKSATPSISLVGNRHRLHVPDAAAVLANRPIR